MDPRDWLFDRRVMRRNLDKKVISMKALGEFLAELPDLDEECIQIETTSRLDLLRTEKEA
jgi:hypothetical protein